MKITTTAIPQNLFADEAVKKDLLLCNNFLEAFQVIEEWLNQIVAAGYEAIFISGPISNPDEAIKLSNLIEMTAYGNMLCRKVDKKIIIVNPAPLQEVVSTLIQKEYGEKWNGYPEKVLYDFFLLIVRHVAVTAIHALPGSSNSRGAMAEQFWGWLHKKDIVQIKSYAEAFTA